jgi:hypothetical protein
METFNPSLGYIMHFPEHGAFSPNDGKVGMTAEQTAEHNARMAELEKDAMKATGRATLYLTKKAGAWIVSNFTGSMSCPALNVRRSKTNWGHDRFDTWFNFDGSIWHGVNIGDNEILRCKRTKQSA